MRQSQESWKPAIRAGEFRAPSLDRVSPSFGPARSNNDILEIEIGTVHENNETYKTSRDGGGSGFKLTHKQDTGTINDMIGTKPIIVSRGSGAAKSLFTKSHFRRPIRESQFVRRALFRDAKRN